MKIPAKSIVTFVGILLGLSVTALYAGDTLIKEIDDADLGSLAKNAASSKKNVMIIYYKENCKACDQLSKKTAGSSKSLSQKFVIYKTDVSSGFNVVCPNKDEYADNDYLEIKGITKLPALVITDEEGNVTFVKNNITDMKTLVAAGQKFNKSKLANRNTNSRRPIN